MTHGAASGVTPYFEGNQGAVETVAKGVAKAPAAKATAKVAGGKAAGAKGAPGKGAGGKAGAKRGAKAELGDDEVIDDGGDFDALDDDAGVVDDAEVIEEVEEVPAPNARQKAKDKRAKEKALIKEALANAKQGVTEEEMEARRTRLRQLIKRCARYSQIRWRPANKPLMRLSIAGPPRIMRLARDPKFAGDQTLVLESR